MPDWFRCTDWNEQREAEFFRRLRRARRQKPQYLVIQAGTLVGTGRTELAVAALNLIELFVQEHFDALFASGAFHTRARAFLMLDRSAEAFQAFEDALAARRAMPNVIDSVWLEYPLTIARRRVRDRYPRALEVLNEFVSPSGMVFPIQQFQYFAALALISAEEADRASASRWARNALTAITKSAPFSGHPDVGLVGAPSADLQRELERLLID
jgi:hypothetical protein